MGDLGGLGGLSDLGGLGGLGDLGGLAYRAGLGDGAWGKCGTCTVLLRVVLRNKNLVQSYLVVNLNDIVLIIFPMC